MTPEQSIAAALGREPDELMPLGGGCVAEVYLVEFANGDTAVAKFDRADSPTLEVEAAMLERLAAHLPVPKILHAAPELLVMEHLPGGQTYSSRAEEHAAELLAGLHSVESKTFGFERDTVIGALHQPNPESLDWIAFFAEHRLLYMANEALRAGRLDAEVFDRIGRLAAALPSYLSAPTSPSLLHGDIWSGNVLAQGDRITGFLDPAIYFGHPEIELAFITMFKTFGEPFFAAYRLHREIEPGFMEERRHIYNLYPYLVHVRLFGGGYRIQVESVLTRLGF